LFDVWQFNFTGHFFWHLTGHLLKDSQLMQKYRVQICSGVSKSVLLRQVILEHQWNYDRCSSHEIIHWGTLMINDKSDVTGTSYEGICMYIFELFGLVSDLMFFCYMNIPSRWFITSHSHCQRMVSLIYIISILCRMDVYMCDCGMIIVWKRT